MKRLWGGKKKLGETKPDYIEKLLVEDALGLALDAALHEARKVQIALEQEDFQNIYKLTTQWLAQNIITVLVDTPSSTPSPTPSSSPFQSLTTSPCSSPSQKRSKEATEMDGDVNDMDTGSVPFQMVDALRLVQTIQSIVRDSFRVHQSSEQRAALHFLQPQEKKLTTSYTFKDGLRCLASAISVQGQRPSNEDDFVIVEYLHEFMSNPLDSPFSPPLSYFAVFDGHAGKQVCDYCRSQLHLRIVSAPDVCL